MVGGWPLDLEFSVLAFRLVEAIRAGIHSSIAALHDGRVQVQVREPWRELGGHGR